MLKKRPKSSLPDLTTAIDIRKPTEGTSHPSFIRNIEGFDTEKCLFEGVLHYHFILFRKPWFSEEKSRERGVCKHSLLCPLTGVCSLAYCDRYCSPSNTFIVTQQRNLETEAALCPLANWLGPLLPSKSHWQHALTQAQENTWV